MKAQEKATMSIETTSGKLQEFFSLPTTRFRFLNRLMIEKKNEWDGRAFCDVELLLSENASPESRRLRLKFLRSVEIQVGDLNGTEGWLIAIRNIADRGLENITYRVVEEEGNSISLNCQDFEYEVLE